MPKAPEKPASAEGKGERTKAKCPICHAVVGLNSLYNHIAVTCQKRGRDGRG